MFFVPAVSVRKGGTSLINELSNLGLLTNLKLCLDAGDLNNYPGSGQTAFDTSGNATNFQFGSTASVDAADPAFVGSAGGQSSGEYFRFPSYTNSLNSAATTFSKSLSKDGALFTLVGVSRISQADATNGNDLVGTYASSIGTLFGSGQSADGSNDKLRFQCVKAGPTIVLTIKSGLTIPVGSPFFYAMSYNESTGAWLMRVNGNEASGTATYSSPSVSDPDHGLALFSTGDPTGGYSGDTFNLAAWSSALSSSDLSSLYTVQKAKFGF